MYSTSDKYKEYIKKDTRHYEIELDIETKAGTPYHIDRSSILKGSFSLVKQCCSNQEIEIGTVYTSELNVTILSDIDRYSLFDAEIRPYFILDMDGEKESIPLGIFVVKDPNRNISCIELTAYDNMIKFDSTFNSTMTIGKPYDFLISACSACDVEFLPSREEIESLPNGKETFSIYEDNDIESWRDVIHYVSTVIGCFAQCDRNGKLDIISYGIYPVTSFDRKHRFKSSYSDFATRFTALSATNLRTNISKYIALEEDDGLTMNIGTNPLLQYGTDEIIERQLNNILQAISLIDYIPFSANILCDPSLDCGDIVKFTGGHADDNGISCITSLAFNNGKDFTISGSGKNPKLASGKSKNDKNIAGLIESSSKNELISYNFTNSKEIVIEENLMEIIGIMYVTKKRTSVEFKATILYELICDEVSDISFIYEVDDNKINTHAPVETKAKGRHITTLFYPLSEVKEMSEHKFRVFMAASSGKVNIDRFWITANINGQGLVSDVIPWDGKVELEEKFSPFTIKQTNQIDFSFVDAGPSIDFIDNSKNDFFEMIPSITIDNKNSIVFTGMQENFDFKNNVVSNTIYTLNKSDMDYSHQYVNDEECFMLNTRYVVNGVISTIDEGSHMTFDIEMKQYSEITHIALEVL